MEEEVWGFGIDEDGFLKLFRVSPEHVKRGDLNALADSYSDIIYFYAALVTS